MNAETIEKVRALANAILALLDEPAAPKTDSVLQPGAVIDIEDVRAVLTKVSGKHGAAATKQLMGSYKKLSDVPHTQWAALIEKAEKLL